MPFKTHHRNFMSFATSDCIVFLAALNQIIEGMKSQSVWFWKEHYHAAIMIKWIKGLLVSKAPCPQSLSTACSKGGFACRVWVEWIVIDSVKGNSVSWSVNVYHLVLSPYIINLQSLKQLEVSSTAIVVVLQTCFQFLPSHDWDWAWCMYMWWLCIC